MKSKKSTLVAAIAGIVILAGAALFIITLFTGTNTEPDVIINDEGLEITGQYGEVYALSDIKSAELQDSIPSIGRKVSGAGLGSIRKGDFEIEGMGVCRVFIDTDSSPYIVMRTSSGYVIINFKDPDKTEVIYTALVRAVG